MYLAKRTLALAVPITLMAFWLGKILMPHTIVFPPLDGFEIVSLIFAAIGVFVYNWFDTISDSFSMHSL